MQDLSLLQSRGLPHTLGGVLHCCSRKGLRTMITAAPPRGSDEGVGMHCNLYVNVYGLKLTLPQGDIDGAFKIMMQLING